MPITAAFPLQTIQCNYHKVLITYLELS